jgi:7-carboxy-7-deazaguanine synthase
MATVVAALPQKQEIAEAPSFPIAEIFFSMQGEGNQAGTAMVFVRLAGCTVGKPYSTAFKKNAGLYVFQNECTTYDGRKFACDTDYRATERLTPSEITQRIRELAPKCKWISITGGEPLMHHLLPLVRHLNQEGFHLHLDTSGTIPLTPEIRLALLFFRWAVVSPKSPFLDEYAELADEIRLLVDGDFDWGRIPRAIRDQSHKIWISAINQAYTIDPEHSQQCVNLLLAHPEIRCSVQLHKIFGVR